jgi:two-component system chemotaxis sensor kinase CheA
VRITVSDDGSGIDRAAVLRAAIARSLLREDEAEALDEAAVHALLFRPGFSTREQVSETSGRGVGLDVVEDALHRAGGSLSVASRPGEGTSFTLDLPLSAAMAPVLLVEAGGHVYALPAPRVETVLHAGNLAEAARLPTIVSLEAALGLPAPVEAATIVVLRGSGGRLLGLSVGRVTRRADLLLRPLHPALATLPGVGAVGVLGTGEPVVVLEPDGFVPE